MALTYRQVLRERYVGRLFAATLCSRLAEEMVVLALVLLVLDRYSAPELAGLVVFASFAPGMVASPLAGALLDRVGAVRGIAVDMLASAVLLAVIAVLPGGWTVLLIGLAALFSLTTPLGIAGTRTLLPRLVPEPALERANALDIASYNLVEVAGPVLAGALFAAVGGPVTLAVVAGLYAAAFGLLASLPTAAADTGGPAPAARRRLLPEALAGVRYVLAHPVLRSLVVSYGLYQVAWGILVVTVPTVVVGAGADARGDGGTAGLLWGVVGLAGLLGALLAGRVLRAGRERSAIVLGTLVTAAAAVPVMAWGGTAGLVGGLVAVGLAAGPINVGLLSLRQRRTDPGWLGRVLAVSISLNLLGMPIGSALGGYLAADAPTLSFVAAGAAAAAASATALVLLRSDARPAHAEGPAG